MLIIASSLIGIDGYFGTPKIAYSQSDPDQMKSNTIILMDQDGNLFGLISAPPSQ
jgi:hypothetical protein